MAVPFRLPSGLGSDLPVVPPKTKDSAASLRKPGTPALGPAKKNAKRVPNSVESVTVPVQLFKGGMKNWSKRAAMAEIITVPADFSREATLAVAARLAAVKLSGSWVHTGVLLPTGKFTQLDLSSAGDYAEGGVEICLSPNEESQTPMMDQINSIQQQIKQLARMSISIQQQLQQLARKTDRQWDRIGYLASFELAQLASDILSLVLASVQPKLAITLMASGRCPCSQTQLLKMTWKLCVVTKDAWKCLKPSIKSESRGMVCYHLDCNCKLQITTYACCSA